MVRVELDLDETEYEDLIEIFEINKKYVSKRALEVLMWDKLEIFLGDLLRYGVGAASDDPVSFIKEFLDEKLPVFKKEGAKDGDKKKKTRFEEEVKKAYN